MKRKAVTSLFLLACISFWSIKAAYAAPLAYIDPNTGGMLFQILAVAFTLLSGFLFFFSSRIRMGFARIMRSIREKSGKDLAENAPQENTQ